MMIRSQYQAQVVVQEDGGQSEKELIFSSPSEHSSCRTLQTTIYLPKETTILEVKVSIYKVIHLTHHLQKPPSNSDSQACTPFGRVEPDFFQLKNSTHPTNLNLVASNLPNPSLGATFLLR